MTAPGAGPPAVILGGGTIALAVARSLGRRGVKVHALPDVDAADPVRKSRYIVNHTPWHLSGSTTDCDPLWMKYLLDTEPGAVVLPCSDDGLEFVARHRAELAVVGHRALESNDCAVLDMLDKQRTYELARKAGVPAPRTATVSCVSQLRSLAEEFGYPCALKPVYSHHFRRHFSGKGAVVSDLAALEDSFEIITGANVEVIITELIPGADQYCSYYSYLDEHGHPLVEFTKRKLRQNPVGFGRGTYHVTSWEPEAAEIGLRFSQSVGLLGLVNIEFKRDERDGELKLIECNPRFTAADDLVRRAGIDLARLAYDRVVGLPVVAPTTFREGLHQWSPAEDYAAFRMYRQQGQLTTAKWVRSLLHRQYVPLVAADDLRPLVARCGELVGRVVQSGHRGLPVPSVKSDSGCVEFLAQPAARSNVAWSTGALVELIGAGKPGCELGQQLDLLRSVKPITLARHRRRLAAFPRAKIDAAVYRKIWCDAALACEAEVSDLGRGFFAFDRRGSRTVVWRNLVKLDDPVTIRMSLDKPLVHDLLGSLGIPVPARVVTHVKDWKTLVGFVERHGRCVVKPATNTGGGVGVTCGVETADDLARAVLRAARWDELVLVEEQIDGDEYRFLFLEGELLDVIGRRPPTVTGDGRQTVASLVDLENTRRRASHGQLGIWPVRIDLDAVLALRRQGLTPESIPTAGTTVRVKAAANESGAADCFAVERTPLGLTETAREGVGALGLRFASVELVAPKDGSEAVVIEVNGTPGLHYHYQLDGSASRTAVAIPLLDSLLCRPSC